MRQVSRRGDLPVKAARQMRVPACQQDQQGCKLCWPNLRSHGPLQTTSVSVKQLSVPIQRCLVSFQRCSVKAPSQSDLSSLQGYLAWAWEGWSRLRPRCPRSHLRPSCPERFCAWSPWSGLPWMLPWIWSPTQRPVWLRQTWYRLKGSCRCRWARRACVQSLQETHM